MSTTMANPFNPTGALQAWNNLGKPVTNNTGVAQPTMGGATSTGVANPYSPPSISAPPASGSGGIVTGAQLYGTPNTIAPGTNGLVPVSTSSPTTTIGGATGGTGGGTGNISPDVSNQLTDIFGQGVGGLIGGEIANLGSDNSAYLQAFENAQAPINAQNLATLQTTLGNEGIGANSSAAAIAQSNFQSQIAGQESAEEQQLTMQDIRDLLGLTQGLEKPAEQEVADSSPWGVFSRILSAGGSIFNDISDVLGGGGGGGNSGGGGGSMYPTSNSEYF